MNSIRIALPKGRLQVGVLEHLERRGLRFEFSSDRDYRPRTADARVAAKLLKVRAIPQLVALGQYELGFCGLDLLEETGYDTVRPLVDLGLNPVQLVVALRREQAELLEHPPRRPLLIATEYERIADRWALARGLSHITIQTWGSTEAYAPEDADIVFDCTETGRTLEANGLVVVERLLRSTTWLVGNTFALGRPEVQGLIEEIRRGD